MQGIGVIKLDHTGTNAAVSFGGPWGESETCIQCGQCALVCPTGALAVKDQTDCALDWFDDPAVTTVVQFAPAVRVTIGESIGARPGENQMCIRDRLCTGPQADAPADALLRNQTLASSTADSMVR